MKTGEFTQYDPVAEVRRGLGASAAVKKGLRSASAAGGNVSKEIISDPVAEMRRSLGVGTAVTRGLNAASGGKGDLEKEISLDPVAEMRRKIRTVGYGQSAQPTSSDPAVLPESARQIERETAGENVEEARTSYTDLRNIRDSVRAQADEMLADYNQRIEEGEKEEDLEDYYLKILERLDKAAEYDRQVGEAYGELQSAQQEYKDVYADFNAARSELSAAEASYSQVLNEYGGKDYEERAAAAAARLAKAREAFKDQGGDPDAGIVAAGLSSAAAGVADAFGYLQELGQPENERRRGIFSTGHLSEVQKHHQEVLEEREKAKYESEHGAGTYTAKPAYQRTQELADRLSGKSAEQIASMKAGRGELGRIAVDMGVHGVQMAADTAAGKLLPGGSLTAMALRSFGSGVREARKDGANLYQQGLYGAASAAVEVLTEKMFDGIAGIYGAGLADDLVSHAIGRFTENKLAQTALALAADALGEGAEEVISDLLNPIIKTIYSDKTVAESFRENWNWSEVLYDFAVGAAMGLVGGSVETVSDMTGLKAPDKRAAFFMAAGESGLSFAETLNKWKEHERRSYDAAQGSIAEEENTRSKTENSHSSSKNAAPEGAAESTAVNTDPKKHTVVEQAVINEYQNAVDEKLAQYVQLVRDGARIRTPYELKSVSPRASADILRITGVDTKGNAAKIEARMVEHILKDHGEHGRTDHSMRDVNDIARIQYVLDTYDSAEDGGQSSAYMTVKSNGLQGNARTVVFSKAVNGTYFIVEAVPDTKAKCVFIVSAYMQKKRSEATPSANAAKTATRVTSETQRQISSDDNSIPFSSEAVNAVERTEQGVVRNGEAAESGEAMKNKGLQSDDEGSIIQNEQSRGKPGADEQARVAESVAEASFSNRIRKLGENRTVSEIMTYQARKTLWRRNGSAYEDLVFVDPSTGKTLSQRKDNRKGSVKPSESMRKMVESRPGEIIAMHNHPHNMLPSRADLENAKLYKYGIILCHNGSIIRYYVEKDANINAADSFLNILQKRLDRGEDISADCALLSELGIKMEVYN